MLASIGRSEGSCMASPRNDSVLRTILPAPWYSPALCRNWIPPLSSRPTPFIKRGLRILRVATHLLRGLAIALFRFPRLSPVRQRSEVRRWSRQLLTILSVRVHATNHPDELPPVCMLVTNHISAGWTFPSCWPAIHPFSSPSRRSANGRWWAGCAHGSARCSSSAAAAAPHGM